MELTKAVSAIPPAYRAATTGERAKDSLDIDPAGPEDSPAPRTRSMARTDHRPEVGLRAAAGRARTSELGIPWWIYVGTSGPTPSKTGKGIYLFLMKTSEDPNIPEFVTVTLHGLVAETPNPSFLELAPRRRLLFCVNEVDDFQGKKVGAVSAFSVDLTSGKLTLVGQRSSMGARPCHLALDRQARHLLVANDGGSVAVLPIGADGAPGEATDVHQHTGKSVHPERQRGPHPQGVRLSPDDRFAFVCDLGLDRVMVYRFDGRTGKLAPHDPPSLACKPGCGPRHLVFHPDGKVAYRVNELDSTVTALGYDPQAGILTELQTLSTLPGYYDGPNRAAEIGVHPTGKFVYVSNCGHNSVVLYGVDPEKGTLTYIEDQSTYGTMPVHFGMDTPGKHFAVANHESGSILILRAPESGRVKPGGGVVKMPAAACAVFLAPAGAVQKP
jgi:6-phosphogluconolactonase